MKKVGIYGGTFDPFHLGHLNLALEILEKRNLDEIWFCPAKISPHKLEEHPAASADHRLKMLHLAIAEIPSFHAVDDEIKREGTSYTVDTLKYFLEQERKKPSPAQLYLILGDDSIQGFFRWHRPEEIVRLVPLLIGSRLPEFDLEKLKGNPEICESIRRGWTPTRIMEISATEIRKRLQNGLYCGHLVPKEVLDYIYKNQLYLS